jgi:hypothetical protein
MFSLKLWLNRQRSPGDDELISAYIDGALDRAAQKAFETRMASEPDLRRKVDATRQLVQAAAQLPPAGLPHNFTLPASTGKPSTSPALWWRVGSAVATAVFVCAVGLDVSGALAPRAMAPVAAPQAAYSFAARPTSAPAATGQPENENATTPEAAADTGATGSTALATPTPEGTSAPAPLMMGMAAVTETEQASGAGASAESTSIPPAPRAKQPASDTMEISAAQAAAQPSYAGSMTATSLPTAEEVAPATAPAPIEQPAPPGSQGIPWLHIVAGLALLVAIGAGFIGWARR